MVRPDIQQYRIDVPEEFPGNFLEVTGPAVKLMSLRYARNPGDPAAFYRDQAVEGCCIANAEVVSKKMTPGFINLEDANMALRAAKKLYYVFPDTDSVCVVKHEIPCGLARGYSVTEALENAWYGDPLAAFGGVVALSGTVDRETAESLERKHLLHGF